MAPEPEVPSQGRGLHVLVVSHGELAATLAAAAQRISACAVEQQLPLEALELGWELSLEDCQAALQDRLRELRPENRVLILTTLFGDTAFRAAARLAEPGEIEVLGGVNLPALIKLTCSEAVSPSTGEELSLRVEALRDRARASIERAPAADGGCGA